jgi:hypothetical protein
MDRDKLRRAIENGSVEWQRHALERIMERGISRSMVKEVLSVGDVIEDYPDDKPFPSALFLSWIGEKAYHVVAAFDDENSRCFVITAYTPDLEYFESDFRTRRQYGN